MARAHEGVSEWPRIELRTDRPIDPDMLRPAQKRQGAAGDMPGTGCARARAQGLATCAQSAPQTAFVMHGVGTAKI